MPKVTVTRGQRSLLPQGAHRPRRADPAKGRGWGRWSLWLPQARCRSLLTSSRCWRWCWPHRPCPGSRDEGHSSPGCPLLPPASRDERRFGPARAALRAAETDTTESAAGTLPGGGRVRRGQVLGSVTPADPTQALTHTWGDPPPEEETAPQNLLVLLKGNVPAHHVIKQHTQRPDGG